MRYNRPEINIELFETENIVTESCVTLKTSVTVNGVETKGTDYGSEDFSIYTE